MNNNGSLKATAMNICFSVSGPVETEKYGRTSRIEVMYDLMQMSYRRSEHMNNGSIVSDSFV